MSIKMPIGEDPQNEFYVYQEFFNEQTVYLQFNRLSHCELHIEGDKLTLGISVQTLERLLKLWEENRSKFEGEYIEFVDFITKTLDELVERQEDMDPEI